MHYLDSVIDDIEPRITAIVEICPTISETTLQSSLASYCWILLDSWVAWNTFRFLLRDSELSENSDKWIKTPASYTASQIKAIWGFNDSELDYVKNNTGFSFACAINEKIQKNRNASAHFTRDFDGTVKGSDVVIIKNLFNCFSVLFRFEETVKFLEKINNSLFFKGGIRIKDVSFSDDLFHPFEELRFLFSDFVECNSIVCHLTNGRSISFEKDYGKAFIYEEDINSKKEITNNNGSYNLFGNKSFYLDISAILNTVYPVRDSDEQ